MDCQREERVHIPQEVIKYAACSRIVTWTRGDFKVEGEALSSLGKLPLKHFVSEAQETAATYLDCVLGVQYNHFSEYGNN